jgi:hypothetical protein
MTAVALEELHRAYAEGQSRTVEVGKVQVTIRYVGGKGRRGRIAIAAPAGAVFLTLPIE